ncbi:hypothetical protein ACWEGQ_01515 [Streptomyces seoulensis]
MREAAAGLAGAPARPVAGPDPPHRAEVFRLDEKATTHHADSARALLEQATAQTRERRQ